MKKFILIALLSTILTACGGMSAPKLDVKVNGKDTKMDVKSGTVNLSDMVFTAPGKPDVKTSAHTIYVANYELDTSKPGWMRNPLTSPDQMRVDIQLTGEEATTKDSPFKVTTYSADADKANGVRFAQIIAFADGKQTESRFDTAGSKMSGNVKITSVTAEAVSGEVDLTQGDKSIKGTFTAKLPGAKK